MHTTRLNLLMQGSIVHSKIQVVTHHYQRFSSSQYLLQMQVQAQQRYSNSLTTKMITYSHTILQQFIAPKSHTTLTLTKTNTCMASPICLPLFSDQHSFQLTQDQKGFFKACNETECKELRVNGTRGVTFVQGFSKKRIRFKGVQARFTHLTRLVTKDVYSQIALLFKIVAYYHFKCLHHLVNRTNGANSRCHHTRFKVSSSHKELAPISNETPHFL
ncbi:hypothetical protein H5410_030444 [Solanum commersonii]|uniref:Uncharacterized protein n=1 Tax=Solanum commersonii TaxID=4109 RepID=A0A9J5YFP5_SOLCO|nr:hypothetical protein H5410_030444 [Solanum commersonii]